MPNADIDNMLIREVFTCTFASTTLTKAPAQPGQPNPLRQLTVKAAGWSTGIQHRAGGGGTAEKGRLIIEAQLKSDRKKLKSRLLRAGIYNSPIYITPLSGGIE